MQPPREICVVFITIRATSPGYGYFFLVFASFGLFCLLIGHRIFWKLKALLVDWDEASDIEDDHPPTMDYSSSSLLCVPLVPQHFRLTIPSLAVYGIMTTELTVCGTSCLSLSREVYLQVSTGSP